MRDEACNQERQCRGLCSVDDINPARHHIYYTSITPRVLVYFGTSRHPGLLLSTVGASVSVVPYSE